MRFGKKEIKRVGVVVLDYTFFLCVFVVLVEMGGEVFRQIVNGLFWVTSNGFSKSSLLALIPHGLFLLTGLSAFLLIGYFLLKLNFKIFKK